MNINRFPINFLKKSSFKSLFVREIQNTDFYYICSWIRSKKALMMVSSEEGNCLTVEVLKHWIASAEKNFVVADKHSNKPIGFCTLSRSEAILPNNFVEFCHQILNPFSISFYASFCLCRAAETYARLNGFEKIITRTLPNNKYAILLAQLEETEEITGIIPWANPPFRWFALEITTHNPALQYDSYINKLKGGIYDERSA